MPFSLRTLAYLYRVCRFFGVFRWFVPPVLVIAAFLAFGVVGAPYWGATWATVAFLFTLLLVSGEIQSFSVFVPDPTLEQTTAPPPSLVYGVATGTFCTWDRYAWTIGEMEHEMAVQIRWLPAEAPPVLAVLSPTDLPANLKDPLKEADRLSLWYPGVEVITGRTLFRGQILPALRLRFVGRQLLVAVREESAAAALAMALRTAGQV